MKFLKSIPKDKLQKLILVVIGSLIGVGVIGNFYIARQLARRTSERERADKLRAQVEEAQTATKSEVSNTRIRDQIKAFVDAQRLRMVSGDSFSWVVREVTLVAEKHPIRVSSMRPGTKSSNATKSRYQMFTVRIEADGTYDQAGAFIKDLENDFPAGEIRSLDLTATDPSHGQCRVAIDLALLMRPEPPVKAVASPTQEEKAAL